MSQRHQVELVVRTGPVAPINSGRADQVVDFRHTIPRTSTFVRAAEVDRREHRDTAEQY